jgi:hypothetical protein
VITRSNIAQAVSKLSKFLTNSFSFHLKSVNRIIKYLSYIKKLSIKFSDHVSEESDEIIFLINSNVLFADDVVTRYNS